MASTKKSSAAVIVFFTVAVMFFGIIFCVASGFGGSVDNDYIIDPYVSYEHINVDVEWNADRTCRITQDIRVRMLTSGRHGIIVDIPVNSGEKIRNLKVDCPLPHSYEYEAGRKLVAVRIGDADSTLMSGATFTCVLTYDYITPKHSEGKDILAIMPIGNGWASYVESSKVTVTYPTAPDLTADNFMYGVFIAGSTVPYKDVKWTNDGKTVTVMLDEGLSPFSGVEVAYAMPSGALKGRFDWEWLPFAICGLILLGIVVLFMFMFGRDKPLTPVVDFYPPNLDVGGKRKHMLPVQMGTIIDGKCSAQDVTSLIFYWASEGYIEIIDEEDGTYLKKIKDIDPVTSYEARLFDELFSKTKSTKDGGELLEIDKSGRFASAISSARSDANDEYRGRLYTSKFTAISILMSIACGLFGVLGAMLSTFRIAFGFINILGVFTVIPVILSAIAGSAINRYYFKLTDGKRKAYLGLYIAGTLLLTIALMFTVPTDVMGWATKIIFALTIGASASIAPFLTVRTPYYTEQLNSILGFRNFIRDAEKERLEMLLEENPQYYYDILPYANVLGVSDIWADKFKDMTLEPPRYYTSRHSALFDLWLLNRLSRNVGSSMTYVPPSKSSGGSFSSGGGGRSGGGGFSGGSFGGGGGRSW